MTLRLIIELIYIKSLLITTIINILTREKKIPHLYYNSWVVYFLIFEKIFVISSVSTLSVHQKLLIFKSCFFNLSHPTKAIKLQQKRLVYNLERIDYQ